MSSPALQILAPGNGAALVGAQPVELHGAVTGNPAGLFFKWFSSLNSAATATHPELNTADHSGAALNSTAPLAEFGTHAIVLTATDQDGIDLPSIKAVTRSAMAGGAPPAAPQPCLVHRLVAQIRTPPADGQTISKANATFEVLAPIPWARQDPPGLGSWILDTDYQKINGIGLKFHFAPDGPPDAAHTADVPLTLATLSFFRADDKTWFRWTGALPANLSSGNYVFTLFATVGAASVSASRGFVLTA